MLKIFYVNLDDSHDRNQQMIKQLDGLGLTYERISAVYGKDLTDEQKSFVNYHDFLLRMKRPMQDGEIGCAMSHRLIWQKMLDDNIEYALILEDDVVIDEDVLSVIHCPSFYQSFDFLNLSSNFPYNPNRAYLTQLLANQPTAIRTEQNNNLWSKIDWGKHWKIYKLHQHQKIIACECDPAPALASGYLLSNKGAKSFLQASHVLDVPIDNVWRHADGELRQAFLPKPLIIQSDIDSNIGDRTKTVQLTLMQKLKRAMLKRKPNPRHADVKRMYHVK